MCGGRVVFDSLLGERSKGGRVCYWFLREGFVFGNRRFCCKGRVESRINGRSLWLLCLMI